MNPKPEKEEKDPNKSFKVFRHIRTNGHGNITACCEVFPNQEKMKIGLAFCSPKEPPTAVFVKETGRMIAESRFDFNPIEIEYLPEMDQSIADFVLDYIDEIIRKREPMPYVRHSPKWLKKFYNYLRDW